MKLLYVEDEADIREIAEYALEDEGFDIVFCASGEQAMEQAADFQPEVILLDVMMPGMDGPTTLKNLRDVPGLQTTPLSFLPPKFSLMKFSTSSHWAQSTSSRNLLTR